jgi:phenylalanine-4-hydroxylase
MTQHLLTREIPIYLRSYIATQDPTLYTPIDHASWRYILKISQAFFAKHAHQKYLDGLRETGISTERIPLISEMDECLRKFNWRAVPVTGFIPPAVFMEYLSLGILPIACDMRTLEHIAYTPAPDIVHEAAGHAPIIADPEYSDYLRSYGEISQKAIYSIQDIEVYQAIRNLSDTKENPRATSQEIQAAQDRLDHAVASVDYVSEATLLSRMGWWTFEYGLVGSLSRPKIYGAGLLSSVGESQQCFNSNVKKIPFSIDCIHTSYDITRPQPQLFIAPDFHTLKIALDELADQMAFRQGGEEGLQKAIQAKTLTTTELESGVQISGILKNYFKDDSERPCYLQFQGPTQLSYWNHEIEGQGTNYHREGFGTPLEKVTEADLAQINLQVGKKGRLEFKSRISVEGKLTNLQKRENQLILLTFDECTVKRGDEFLFRPEWGKYDMVCGEKVVSVFGGAADRERYLEATGGFHQDPGKQKTNLTEENRELNLLYARVRKIRETSKLSPGEVEKELIQIHQNLEEGYPQDWLLRYELIELCSMRKLNLPWIGQIKKKLQEVSTKNPEIGRIISRGLELLE